ncbi:MAG TPA: 3-dehydroquinate synthase [Vicinamibacterales bacterium]
MANYGFSVPFEFPLHFTRGVFDRDNQLLETIVSRLEPARRHRLLVVVDERVAAANPHLHDDVLGYAAAHARSIELVLPPVVVAGGEAAKNDIAHALSLLKVINDTGLDRQSYVVIVGGGAVLDMASFAAAIAHRGIRVVRMPTTVLAQADSGVGVKNSINLFGKKNFAGTFVPPFAVINDLDFLETLEKRDRIAGVVEAVKVALLKDARFFEDIAANASRVVTDSAILRRVIERSAELHLQHICGNGDPFELGSARPLDFGHWAAHKLESMTHHRLRHGEAVAIGIALDVAYSVRKGYLDRASADRIITVLEKIGFQLWDDALEMRERDGRHTLITGLREFREHLGGELHITLLRGIGASFEVTEMDERLILESIEDLARLRPAFAKATAR